MNAMLATLELPFYAIVDFALAAPRAATVYAATMIGAVVLVLAVA